MKKIFFVAVALAIALSAQAQKANIQFEKTTIDLGKFGGDDLIKKCHFVFKNTGDAKLYIHQIFTSCGCTTNSYPTHGIEPGASDTIFVTYNGHLRRLLCSHRATRIRPPRRSCIHRPRITYASSDDWRQTPKHPKRQSALLLQNQMIYYFYF